MHTKCDEGVLRQRVRAGSCVKRQKTVEELLLFEPSSDEGSDCSSVHETSTKVDVNKEITPPLVQRICWNNVRTASQLKINAEATKVFLKIVEHYWPRLCDSKTKNSGLWQEIAIKMLENGFQIKAPDPGKSAQQKWNNLNKEYKKFVLAAKGTGGGEDVLDCKPPFFDEIEKILGKGNAAYPEYIGDSSMGKQNPTRLSKVTENQTNIDDGTKKRTSTTEHVIFSDGPSGSETPNPSNDNYYIRQLRFSDDDDDGYAFSSQPKKRKKTSKATNVAKAIDILIANKAERAAEREERRKRHEESEAAKQKRHEDMLMLNLLNHGLDHG
ncbi:uncharacterized protein LOC123471526 isoform X1 [Daphnia magna]|uniref:uncharacterized protein LOC123471526 isoform X1 n=1 Tax=Daphnia magna TaxID=35525 RepID=UPI001E1BA0FD|nr:uncharacterized protein LOC123471526 isoform X1 [Daphnia magna]